LFFQIIVKLSLKQSQIQIVIWMFLLVRINGLL